MQSEVESLWTVDDVAGYLKVSKHTIYKWNEHGRIPALKIGGQLRFNPDAVRAWALEQQTEQASPRSVPPASSRGRPVKLL